MPSRRPLLLAVAVLALPLAAGCTSQDADAPETTSAETTPTAVETTPVEIPGPQDREVTRVMVENGEVAQGAAALLPANSRFRVEAACLAGDPGEIGAVTLLIDGQKSTAKEMPCNGTPVSIQMLGKATDANVQISLSVPEGDDVVAYGVGTAE